jgi:hypothetical protein
MTRMEGNREYEAPELQVIGSVHALTQSGGDDFCIPFINKAFGNPDYFNHIPITNCS